MDTGWLLLGVAIAILGCAALGDYLAELHYAKTAKTAQPHAPVARAKSAFQLDLEADGRRRQTVLSMIDYSRRHGG